MSSCFSNRAETRGFYSVFVALVLNVPVKKIGLLARATHNQAFWSDAGACPVQFIQLWGGFVKWEMFILGALSGEPTGGTR
ncbi:hypothetical protein [Gimesia panareensis]|uniref:hypothetical protein n=1 Tax=Gimesia panareensis TaxID=2527978 RepID=UPI00118D37A6|nr:hypothetical protein [Gimesia panareensis]QDU50249.1 hypothetical protein Pan110_25930 [Gimesia panareensis]